MNWSPSSVDHLIGFYRLAWRSLRRRRRHDSSLPARCHSGAYDTPEYGSERSSFDNPDHNADYRIMPTETLVTWFFGTIPGPLGSPFAKPTRNYPDILSFGGHSITQKGEGLRSSDSVQMYLHADLWLEEEGLGIAAAQKPAVDPTEARNAPIWDQRLALAEASPRSIG